VATPYQQVIEIVSKGATSTLKVLNNIEKSLTNIFKKQEAVNRAALKFNKVRAATRRVKGSGLNLSTNTPLEGLDDKARERKLGKLSGTTRRYVVALNKANKELNAYVRSLATADGAQNKFTGSSRKITTQVSALQERLNSLSRSNKEYTSTLQATLRGEQALYKVQRNRAVDELAQFPEVRLKKDGTPDKRFTRTGVSDLVSTTIAEFDDGKVARSINGLDNYIGRLEALKAKVELGGQSFRQLEEQISRVNRVLEEGQLKGQSSKIEAAAKGPATKLDSIDAFRQKERFASDLNKEEDKRLRLLSRINDSSLAEVTKQKLKNQLSESDVQLQQKELELAKATNKEVDRELSSLNKKQQRQQFRKSRRSEVVSSALIGGGFPFLFGGGPLQAVAGALGGGIGAAVTPKGGFAGSIAATAAISQISQAVGAVAELGKAMNFLTADISAMTKAAGLAGTAEEKRLQFTEQVLGKQAAFNEAIKEMTSVVGQDGVEALQRFGEETNALSNAWNKFMSRVRASLANAINNSGIVQRINNILNRDSGIPFAQSKFASEQLRNTAGNLSSVQASIASKESDLGEGGGIKSGDARRAAITRLGKETYQAELKNLQVLKDQEKVLKEQIKDRSALEKAINDATQIQKIVNEATFGDMDKQNQLLKETIRFGGERAQLNEKIREVQEDHLKNLQAAGQKITELSPEEKERVADAVRLNDQLRRTAELYEQIKDTVATGLTNAITGLIEGTKTLGESLAGIAKSIAGMFLQSAISNIVGGIPMPGAPKKLQREAQGTYMANGIKPFAYGGIATKPTLGLVGEAGEDEYIIPASKMAASMQRYSAGARGEAVIPGTGSSYAGGGAGGSTTVNYSGPILNFNSEEFVPKSAVGQIIATATSRGAKAGEARTLSSLQNSRSRRSNLGL